MEREKERKKLLQKLKEICSYEDFVGAVDTYLDTEEECQYVLNAIESRLVENSVDITLLAVAINQERKKTKGKGDYLKKLEFKKIDFSKLANRKN